MTKPSMRDRLRPFELLGLSAVVALFIGVVVAVSARELQLGLVFGGVTFILSLIVFAMLALSTKPTGDERTDLDEQDRGAGHH